MRGVRTAALVSAIVVGLGCGGVAPLGGGASDGATALCAHLAEKNDCPCTAVPEGAPASIGGFEVRVDAVRTWTALSKLPEIQNVDERSLVERVGGSALVLEVSYTNTTPVKADAAFVAYLLDGDGEDAFVQPYNAKVYMKDRAGWIDLWDDRSVGPGKTRQTALVYAVAPDAIEGSKLILRRNERKPDPEDPRGRMKTFTVEQVVVDLPPPQP